VVRFVCDTMRIFSTVNIEQHEFDNIMDADIEGRGPRGPGRRPHMNKTADALPGLGIVAAVLGVVITMGKLNEPPEVLVTPSARPWWAPCSACSLLRLPWPHGRQHGTPAKELRPRFWWSRRRWGLRWRQPPPVALEAGRRAIPTGHRPTFEELEEAIKISKGK
jgi:chemotaxis protein MotA